MRTAASRYRLAYWDSVAKDDKPVPPALAMGWIGSWLVDPELRAEVIEAYSWIGPGARRSAGWLNERDLNTFVRPMVERALISGELVLVERAPIAGWKPAIADIPREEATTGGAGAGVYEQPKPSKTWIEFLVTDMSVEPVADVRYEAKLVDGTAKEGKTDSKGLVRFDEIETGLCEFRLVDYDGDAVESKEDAERRAKKTAEAKPDEKSESGTGADAVTPAGDEVFVLAAAIKLLGDVPLVKGVVRIIDPDTDQPVGEAITTNEKGEVRVEVPEKKAYRIEIEDDELETEGPEPPPPLPEPQPAVLVCQFVNAAGEPLDDEPVKFGAAAGDGDDFTTDEKGRIRAPAELGPCKLEVRGQAFVAHSLPVEDGDNEACHYRFVVEEK
ncbi:MAG: hypothetical protein ABIS67_03130 [Candidatus Eisenbacteria bacterium]